MKRTIYLTYYRDDEDKGTPEKVFNSKLLFLYDQPPDCPYIEVEMKVVYHQPKYLHQRTKFSDKIGASIIIPKEFNKE